MEKLIPVKNYDNAVSFSIACNGVLYGGSVFLKDIKSEPIYVTVAFADSILNKLLELKIIKKEQIPPHFFAKKITVTDKDDISLRTVIFKNDDSKNIIT